MKQRRYRGPEEGEQAAKGANCNHCAHRREHGVSDVRREPKARTADWAVGALVHLPELGQGAARTGAARRCNIGRAAVDFDPAGRERPTLAGGLEIQTKISA